MSNPNKPIDPKTHGMIDYGLAAFQLMAPDLLGFGPIAKLLCYAFGGAIGTVNALSGPAAIKPVLSFREHGKIEQPMLPALIILPWLTGQLRRPVTRTFFVMNFVLACANYFLTDFEGEKQSATARPRVSARKMVGAGI